MRRVFVTGAGGAVGRELVRRLLLETDDHLDVLIRSSHDDLEVEDYLHDVVEIEPAHSVSRRVTVHAGDCVQARLGLPDDEFVRLRREVSHIVHAAAVTRFDLPLDRARQLNTATVAHVLDLARSCPRLQGFFLLSTVYVAGRRVGTIRERESARPDGFVNTYEQSKHEAEELVAAAAGEVPGVVFRLSTLFGDSRSGRVTHFTAPHQALRIIYSGLASMLPGDPAGRVDLLPVDYAVRAMLTLLETARPGDVLHLAAGANRSFTLEEIIDASHESLGKRDPSWRDRAYPKPAITTAETFRLYLASVRRANNVLLASVLGALEHFVGQLTYPKDFERSTLLERLPDYDRCMPHIAEYFGSVVNYCLETEWGRRVHGARARAH